MKTSSILLYIQRIYIIYSESLKYKLKTEVDLVV